MISYFECPLSKLLFPPPPQPPPHGTVPIAGIWDLSGLIQTASCLGVVPANVVTQPSTCPLPIWFPYRSFLGRHGTKITALCGSLAPLCHQTWQDRAKGQLCGALISPCDCSQKSRTQSPRSSAWVPNPSGQVPCAAKQGKGG